MIREREVLPDRRAAVTLKARIEGNSYYLTFGEYADGRLGEVFISANKYGSFSRGILDALARMTSLALQSGVPVAEVVNSLRGLNFPPQGSVSGSISVTEASSVTDWVAQEIEAAYLKRETSHD